MIWNIPIEPFEGRYSSQWIGWFDREFKSAGVEFTTICPPPITDKITKGAFLDVAGTNYFKASQLQIICKLIFENKVRDGDVFFFHDLWFPGIEMLAYMRDGLDLDFKICGCLHAGTYDPHDFLTRKGMGIWGKHLEQSWIQFVDKIFVATSFHKRLIQERRDTGNKIYLTGFPIYAEERYTKPQTDRERMVVFPHRKDPEKQPELFYELSKRFEGEDIQFVYSQDVTSNKSEYYDLLCKARVSVSFALQETWGIAMQESLFCGCIPFVPARLSYMELYHSALIYRSIDELITYIKEAFEPGRFQLAAAITRKRLKEDGSSAIPTMIRELTS